MSRRAASRLESLGFTQVLAYPGAKTDWMAFGLPIEGEHADAPTAGKVARLDVPICRLLDTLDDITQRVRATDWSSCIVVNDAGVVLGRIDDSVLNGDATKRAQDVMEEGPTTVRPSAELPDLVKRMREQHVESIVVTNSDGVLLGVLRRDDAEAHIQQDK